MGWERPGPDSILPRGAPARPLRLSSFALLLYAQALHKVFDLTRGDGRRWSLRQTGDPAPWPPSTSTNVNPRPSCPSRPSASPPLPSPHLTVYLPRSRTFHPPGYPNPFRFHSICSSDNCPQPHAHASRISRRSHMLIFIHSLVHSSHARACVRTVLDYLCIIAPF